MATNQVGKDCGSISARLHREWGKNPTKNGGLLKIENSSDKPGFWGKTSEWCSRGGWWRRENSRGSPLPYRGGGEEPLPTREKCRPLCIAGVWDRPITSDERFEGAISTISNISMWILIRGIYRISTWGGGSHENRKSAGGFLDFRK